MTLFLLQCSSPFFAATASQVIQIFKAYSIFNSIYLQYFHSSEVFTLGRSVAFLSYAIVYLRPRIVFVPQRTNTPLAYVLRKRWWRRSDLSVVTLCLELSLSPPPEASAR